MMTYIAGKYKVNPHQFNKEKFFRITSYLSKSKFNFTDYLSKTDLH